MAVSSRNKVEIEVDRQLCYGFGDCVDTAPAVFELDDENVSVVKDPDGAPLEEIVEAAQNCPVDAIIITGDDGEQIYP
jgi:ferredoxin